MQVRPLLTIDNNPIIALERFIKGEANERETQNAIAVQELVALHKAGHITLQTTICTALEAPLFGQRPRELQEFISHMTAIGLGDVLHLQLSQTLGFREGDATVFDLYREHAYQQIIHKALFPKIDLNLGKYRRYYCQQHGLDADLLEDMAVYREHGNDAFRYHPQRLERLARAKEACAINLDLLDHEEHLQKKWHNAFNDSYGLYIHISRSGSIFVTDDDDFYKESRRNRLRQLVPGKILRPPKALEELLAICR